MQRLPIISKQIIIAMLLWCSLCAPANAACTALPVLSELLVELDTLHQQTRHSDITTSAERLLEKRLDLTPPRLMGTLAPVGFERKLNDVIEFRIKLGVLIQYALAGDGPKVATYFASSDFQRRYLIVKDLVDEVCGTSRLSGIGTLASGEHLEPGRGKYRRLNSSSKGVVAVIGLFSVCLVLLIGMAIATILRREMLAREKRRNKRYPCNMPVMVSALSQSLELMIVDVSIAGANLESEFIFPTDSRLDLKFADLQRKSTITWSNSEFSGVQFDQPLSTSELEAILDEFGGTDTVSDDDQPHPTASAS